MANQSSNLQGKGDCGDAGIKSNLNVCRAIQESRVTGLPASISDPEQIAAGPRLRFYFQ